MRLKGHVAIPVVLALVACGDDSGGPTTPPEPPPPSLSVSVTCQPSPLNIGRGCGSATCTITSMNGFSGQVRLDCAEEPEQVECYFGPNPTNVPANGAATVAFTVSVAAGAQLGMQRFRVVGNGGGATGSFDLRLALNGILPPEIRGKSMTITGCAGYLEGIPNRSDLQHFRSVFVGAWRFAPRGQFCEQTLSAEDGSFNLTVPRCFGENETVHLTAGGLDTCVSIPYREGTVARVDLFGRREACP